jgi:hypothetical protein
LITDDGFVYRKKTNISNANYESDSESVVSVEDPSIFVDMRIGFKKSSEIHYERSYPRLQDKLLRIGGFIRVCFLSGFFLCFPLVKNKLEIWLLK